MERTIRIRISIKDGKRTLGNDDLESLKKCEKEIGKIQRRIKKIEKNMKKNLIN
jgi:hypothetical protein